MSERIGRALPPPSGRPPAMNIVPQQVKGLDGELKVYHQMFTGCFVRREQRAWALKYLQGQMLDLRRKSIEPMAVALEDGNIQAMQQFISQGAWSDPEGHRDRCEEVLAIHQRGVAESLGHPDGVLIVDGCEFPKQGAHSVGVARQYCGPLGKVANCQASVVLGYASQRGATLLDRRLFLPQEWFDPAHRQRWQACGIPEEVSFQTKAELGAEMIEAVVAGGAVPFQWVTMDEGYGLSPSLLEAIAGAGKYFLAEMARNKQAWRRRPKLTPPQRRTRAGRPPTRWHLAADAPPAQAVDELVRSLRPKQWQAFILHPWFAWDHREGSKGPLEVEIAAVRVVMAQDGLPGSDEWLVVRRPVGEADATRWKFYHSNAPADTPLKTLARLTAWRWPVESVIEECKDVLGLDEYRGTSVPWYQVRG